MKRIIVVGGGGHGRAVAEVIALACEYQLVGFLDDSGNQRVWELPVLGSTADLDSYRLKADTVVVAIGNNATRQVLQGRAVAAGFGLATRIY